MVFYHVLQSPSKHDGVIKSLEKELDYYKGECASLQEMVKKKLVDSAQASPKKKGKVGNERKMKRITKHPPTSKILDIIN